MTVSSNKGFSVVAERVTVSVPDHRDGSSRKKLLNDISFRIEPGDFICVLGPSGSGKSTLVRAILGDRELEGGRLLVGGHDVFREAKNLRGAIGYLPQHDINPTALPVERALHYASHVRLPAETTPQERQAAIERAIEDVGLTGVQNSMIGSLSGGEAKRASLAAELLASPGLLIVDEATSSLDPATETRIMKLLAARAESGTTVIAVTHHLSNVDQATKILILGHDEVVWFGSRVEALAHFNVFRLAHIYTAIEDQPPGYWSARWRAFQAEEGQTSQVSQNESTNDRKSDGADERETVELVAAHTPGFVAQCSALFRREIETFVRDRFGLRTALLLPILLALSLLAGFWTFRFSTPMLLTRYLEQSEKEVLADMWGEVREAISTETIAEQNATIPGQIRVFLDSQPKVLDKLREPSTARNVRDALSDAAPLMPDREIPSPWGTFMLISVMSTCMIILGFVTGFREIVKERTMLDLERRHGLRFFAYVVAKVAAMAIVLAFQIATFRTMLELGLLVREALGGDAPAAIYRAPPVLAATYNWLAALACATIGLIASACVRSTDKGVTVVPLLVTPQMLLGALFVPVKGGLLKVCAMIFSPLYWAYRGCRREADGVPDTFHQLGPYDPAPWIPAAALVSQILAAILITFLVLW